MTASCACGAVTDQQQVFYAFTESKEGRFPVEILGGFGGECLLVDGGSEFNQVVTELDLVRAGCWSHLRTYFFDALPLHPHEAGLAIGFRVRLRADDLAPA